MLLRLRGPHPLLHRLLGILCLRPYLLLRILRLLDLLLRITGLLFLNGRPVCSLRLNLLGTAILLLILIELLLLIRLPIDGRLLTLHGIIDRRAHV